MKSLKISLAFLLGMIILLLACCDVTSVLPILNQEKGELKISIKTGEIARTLSPSLPLDVASYDIEGDGPGSAEFKVTGFTGTTFTKSDLFVGTWTVTVKGKNSNGTEIVMDSKTVQIKTALVTESSFLCTPIAGNGFFAVTLAWPTGLVVSPSVEASLTPDEGGDAINLDFSETDGSASCNSTSVMNGYYTLNLKLLESSVSKRVWSWVETVLIVEGQTTTGTWTLAKEDMNLVQTGGISLSIGSDSKKPVDVTLSGNKEILYTGSTMTVTASGNPVPDSWKWYLDGDLLADQTGSSYSTDAGLEEGSHSLVAVAKKGGISGSKGIRFRVTPEQSVYSKSDSWSSFFWSHDNPYNMINDATVSRTSFPFVWKSAYLGDYDPMILTGDVQGDSKLEVIISGNGVVNVYSAAGASLSTFNLPSSNQRIVLLADIDGDAKSELFSGLVAGTTTTRAYSYDGTVKKTFSGPAPGDSGIFPIKVIDGKLYANVTTGYSLQPRGLLRFDVATEAQDWFFSTGCATVYSAVALDADDDGEPEIALGSGTVHNGATGNGWNGNSVTTDDDNIWIVTINADGSPKLVAKPDGQDIDGEILTFFYDYQSDKKMDLIVCEEHPAPYYNGIDKIRAVDMETGVTLKSVDLGPNQWYWTPIFDGDRIYVVMPASDTVKVFDTSLNLISTHQLPSFDKICFLNDVDGDGKRELAVADASTLSILNLDTWEVEYSKTAAWKLQQAIVSDLDGDDKNEILVYAGELICLGIGG
jgi:hypothetical protein